MFGNLGEMAGLLKKAKDFQSNIQNVKEEMATNEYTGQDANGKVTVVVSGDFIIKSITISPEYHDDITSLQEIILSAANNAMIKAKTAIAEKMKSLTGGINIPGLF
jgi:DNA-binding YbaB/EbfC family protein